MEFPAWPPYAERLKIKNMTILFIESCQRFLILFKDLDAESGGFHQGSGSASLHSNAEINECIA